MHQPPEESPPTPSRPLVLALGSNLGDRLAHLRAGLGTLSAEGIQIDAVSRVYETPAIGFLQQPSFLNVVALARSHLSPSRLLSIFQSAEDEAGRQREFRNGPRTLDVDLILLGDLIVREEGLRVPHPRWRGRSFVVLPLAEIAPGLRDPETGWEVQEIARKWVMQPEQIRVVSASGVFERK